MVSVIKKKLTFSRLWDLKIKNFENFNFAYSNPARVENLFLLVTEII